MSSFTVMKYLPALFEEITVKAPGGEVADAQRCRACGHVFVGVSSDVPAHECSGLTEGPARTRQDREAAARELRSHIGHR